MSVYNKKVSWPTKDIGKKKRGPYKTKPKPKRKWEQKTCRCGKSFFGKGPRCETCKVEYWTNYYISEATKMEYQHGVNYKLVTVHLNLHQTGVDHMTAVITVQIPDYLVDKLPYPQVDQIAISKAKEKVKNYMTDSESCRGSVASITDMTTAEKELLDNE